MVIAILLLAIFFAITMGGSGITPSFAAEYGSGAISRKWASVLFGCFVILGAYLIGWRVSKTIAKGFIDPIILNTPNVLILFVAVSTGLLISNLMHIPPSTSQTTIFGLVGLGLANTGVKWGIFYKVMPLWLLLPFSALIITFLIGKFAYPKLVKLLDKKFHKSVKFWDILTSCYTAFSIGSNNVANAAGPLIACAILTNNKAVFLLAPFFGIGGYLLGLGNLNSVGKKITDLDLISAAIISLVTGTLLISASLIGLPQSLVQLNAFAIFGFSLSIGKICKKTTRKAFILWAIIPLYSFCVAYLLSRVYQAVQGQDLVNASLQYLTRLS